MIIADQVKKIKFRLGLETRDNDEVLTNLFDEVLGVALCVCNIDSLDNILTHKSNAVLAIVCEAVTALFNQRGNEGSTGFSTGGQGSSYINVYDDMRNKLIKSGCRLWR